MTTSNFDPNDPRLTAWLLGELASAERDDFERFLNAQPAARAEIELLRGACENLRAALLAEPAPVLDAAQRQQILSTAARTPASVLNPPRRGYWKTAVTVAGTLASCALLITVIQQATHWREPGGPSGALTSTAIDANRRAAGELITDLRAGGRTSVENRIDQSETTGSTIRTTRRDESSDVAGMGFVGQNQGQSGSGSLPAESMPTSQPDRFDASGPGVIESRPGSKRREQIDGLFVDRPEIANSPGGGKTAIEDYEHETEVIQPGGTRFANTERVEGDQGNGESPATEAAQQKMAGPQGGSPTGVFNPETAPIGATTSTRPLSGEARSYQAGDADGDEYLPVDKAGRPRNRGSLGVTLGKDGLKSGVEGVSNRRSQISGSSGSGGFGVLAGTAPQELGEQKEEASQSNWAYREPSRKSEQPIAGRFAGGPGRALSLATASGTDERLSVQLEREAGRSLGDRLQESNSAEEYAAFADNPFLSSRKAPLSTFGVDVDTASYANVRRFLNGGQLPPPQAVRIEELLNYFRYDDPAPTGDVPFSVSIESGACPWTPSHRLVRIGLAGREVLPGARPAANLVFLIDVSGSMASENKLPLVKHSLKLLLSKLDGRDRLAIVTYSDTARVALPSTLIDDRAQIHSLIDSLVAAGSTNGADGIRLAYNEAVHHFADNGINRVVLCTDGDFNVGTSNDDELVRLIEERRRSQVFFSVYGYGMGNLKDGKLEKLADHGNGHYGYIDGETEARKAFVEDAEANLVTIAQDVKIQVEFNPVWVGEYRLIGYENRVLAAADFRNDKVDAGDIGAGHRVTALYEIVPPGESVSTENAGPKLRYSTPQEPVGGPLAHELLTVRLRYKSPGEETSREIETQYLEEPRPASANMQWSAAVAAFGMLLRHSPHRGGASIPMVLELAQGGIGEDPHGHRREFLQLAQKLAPTLTGTAQPAQDRLSAPALKLTAEEAERIATRNGRYSNLLRVIPAAGDRELYGEVQEYGRWEGREYQGHANLPVGYWVYVAPNWYIWGDAAN